MQTTGSWTIEECNLSSFNQPKQQSVTVDQEEALDHAMIAELSNQQIRRMTLEELIRVIQAAPLDLMSERCRQRLHYSNRFTLERLVYLARFSSQNLISRTLKLGNASDARFDTKKKSTDSDCRQYRVDSSQSTKRSSETGNSMSS